MFPVALSAAIVLLLAWYVFVSYEYPYYFVWDMDYVTSLDSVLIHSGLLPDHIHHTGFGMYLPLFFTQKIAHSFDTLSALDLADLAGSLNPLVAMAELTSFIRLHSPFLVLSIVVLLCVAMCLISGLLRWYLFFFLIFLGTQESLTYHATMVRTELFSVFYWSGAILTMAMAVKARSATGKCVSLLVMGILLGLCFLTKVQSLFYVAALPLLLILISSIFTGYQKQAPQNLTPKAAHWILPVSLFNVVAFWLLGDAAHSTAVPDGIPVWADSFGVTRMSVLFFLALLLLFLCQLFLFITKRTSSDIFRFSSFFTVIAAGFFLSFALHFLLYSDTALSLRYMLLNFKMVFLRESDVFHFKDLSVYISSFLSYLNYNPTLFIVNIALNLLLVLGWRFGFVRITRGQLALCLLVTVLAFVNIFIATRLRLRDILWRELLLNFLNLLYFSVLVTRAARYRLTLARVGGGMLIVLFLVNCIHTHNMPERIDANYNHYGWQADQWLSGRYGGNQRKYSKIMREKYDRTNLWLAKAKAVDHKRIRRTVDFVFKNQTITHRNIGVALEGFSAWTADLDYKITKVPPRLQGAALVDNASVALNKTGFFKEEYVREPSEHPDKFRKSSLDRRISVLTRADLRIFLFVAAGDVSSLLSDQIIKTPLRIVLRNANQSIELHGLEIKNYCEIPLDKVKQKFFFIIRKI